MVTFNQGQQAPVRTSRSDENERHSSLSSIPLPSTDDPQPQQLRVQQQHRDPDPQRHLKTYTAGEDGSRLQQAAQELGLARMRQPRSQVRKVHGYANNPMIQRYYEYANRILLDTGTEDARMQSVYVPPHGTQLPTTVVSDHASSSSQSLPSSSASAQQQPQPQQPPDDPHLSSSSGNLFTAVLGVIKAMVGPAILYLPHAFSQAGYATVLPILALSTTLFLYSSQCLLDSWKSQQTQTTSQATTQTQTQVGLQQQNNESTPLMGSKDAKNNDNHNTAVVFLSYPELAYRALGRPGQLAVQTGIALMQSGVCLTYLIFVPQNLHTACLYFTNGRTNIGTSWWLVFMVLWEIPTSWIRDIRKLTPTNLLANLLILYGLITCLSFALDEATSTTGSTVGTPATVATEHYHHHHNATATVASTHHYRHPFSESMHEIATHVAAMDAYRPEWFLFIGTSVLLFEGSITLLVPLQQAIDSPKQRDKFPLTYRYTILSIIIFEFTFGIICWMAFGDGVRTVLTTSLPTGNLATSVQLAYSVAVLFTFPLQNFPALEIATQGLGAASERLGGWRLPRNVCSSLLVCLLALVAVATMDHLDKVVSLMGSMLGCPIALCFPPLLHTKLCRKELTTRRLWINRAVTTLGVAAMVVASTTTLMTW